MERNEQQSKPSSVLWMRQLDTRPDGIQIDVENLSYDLVSQPKRGIQTRTRILHEVSFKMVPGTLTALMGPSGAGKSTLLDLIADRKLTGEWSGDIYFNNGTRSKFLDRDSAYIMQDDLQIATLTVREAIYFSANFRMAEGTSDADINERVDALIELMSLQSVANSFVGDELNRGISGGELKRLSIAVEMVALPHLVFLDEPTSGLDSTMALDVIRTVRRLASENRTCIASIHQPSREVFAMFDYVLILAEGRMVYFGAISEVQNYFCNDVFQYAMERGRNTADFVMEIAEGLLLPSAKHAGPLTTIELESSFKTSVYAHKLDSWSPKEQRSPFNDEEDIEIGEVPEKTTEATGESKTYLSKVLSTYWTPRRRIHATTRLTQFKLLLFRNFVSIIRDRQLLVSYLGSQVLMGTLYGAVFYQQGHLSTPIFDDGNSNLPDTTITNLSMCLATMLIYIIVSNVPALPYLLTRTIIFRREVAAYAYAVSPYWLAHCLCIIPLQCVGSFLFVTIIYLLVGFGSNFGVYFSIFFFTSVVSYYYAMFVAAICPNAHAAYAAYMTLFGFLSVFMGNGITVNDFPTCWVWAPYVNFTRWLFEGLMANQWSGYDDDNTQGKTVLETFDFPQDFNIGITYMVLVVCTITYTYGIYRGLSPPVNLLRKVAPRNTEAVSVTSSVQSPLSVSNTGKTSLKDSLLPGHRGGDRGGDRGEQHSTSTESLRPHFHDGAATASIQEQRPVSVSVSVLDQAMSDTCCLTFTNVSYVIDHPTPSGVVSGGNKVDAITAAEINAEKHSVCLLHSITGAVRPNEMCALMGTSGAGKSTLLDILAHRKTVGTVSGHIAINGCPVTRDVLMRKSAYVIQETSHIYCPYLTVRETLDFASHFLLPETVSLHEKTLRVNEFLYLLRLQHVADSVIGDQTTKGISGGQRRRVLIGAEILHLPALLYLDEPTTGLDSVSANELLSILRLLANQHRTILCTIHQPAESCFAMFDKVLLLAKGGRMAYFGDVDAVKSYFELSVYRFTCEENRNVADYMLDIASGIATTTVTNTGTNMSNTGTNMTNAGTNMTNTGTNMSEKRKVTVEEICDLFTSSATYFALQETLQHLTTSLREKYPPPPVIPTQTTQQADNHPFYPTSSWFQAQLLFRRLWMERRRNTSMFIAPFIKSIFMGFIFGSAFFQLDDYHIAHDDNDNEENIYRYRLSFLATVMNFFLFPHMADVTEMHLHRKQLYHETNSRKFSLFGYWLAYVAIKLFGFAMNIILYAVIVYSLAGLHNSESTGGDSYFLYFLTDCCLTEWIGFFFAMTAANCAATVEVSSLVFVVFAFMNLIFEGLIVYGPNLPPVLRWIPSLVYMRYSVQGAVLNEFRYNTNALPLSNEFIDNLGFQYLNKGECMLILCTFGIGFAALSYITMFIQWEKR